VLAAVKSKGVVNALPEEGLTVKEKIFELPKVLYLVQAIPSCLVVEFYTETHT
jgi:hypothetical protein